MNICQACINDEEMEIPEASKDVKFVLCDRHQDRTDDIEIGVAAETIVQSQFRSMKSAVVSISARNGKRIGNVS